MSECQICYDLQPNSDIIFLICTHSLCDKCYHRLTTPCCPFCRCKFIKEDDIDKKDRFIPQSPRIHVRVRRNRRRRRTVTEHIERVEGQGRGSIIVETAFSLKKKKNKKQGKNNYKKGRWAKSRLGNRYVTCR